MEGVKVYQGFKNGHFQSINKYIQKYVKAGVCKSKDEKMKMTHHKVVD